MNQTNPIDLAKLKACDFNPHLNTEFNIPTDQGGSVPLKLVEIKEHERSKNQAEGLKREPFSLVFACLERVIPPNTYRLQHLKMGNLDIFLSPFAAEGDGCKLEAVFS